MMLNQQKCRNLVIEGNRLIPSHSHSIIYSSEFGNHVIANKIPLNALSYYGVFRWKACGIVRTMAESSPPELEQTPAREAQQKLKDECDQLWLKVQEVSAV